MDTKAENDQIGGKKREKGEKKSDNKTIKPNLWECWPKCNLLHVNRLHVNRLYKVVEAPSRRRATCPLASELTRANTRLI